MPLPEQAFRRNIRAHEEIGRAVRILAEARFSEEPVTELSAVEQAFAESVDDPFIGQRKDDVIDLEAQIDQGNLWT